MYLYNQFHFNLNEKYVVNLGTMKKYIYILEEIIEYSKHIIQDEIKGQLLKILYKKKKDIQ